MPLTTGEDEDAVEDTDCPDLSPHGEGSPARGEPSSSSSSSSSAKFWEALLKEKHEQLLKEEEQQVREQWQTSHLRHVDTSPALDAAGELLHLSQSHINTWWWPSSGLAMQKCLTCVKACNWDPSLHRPVVC